MSPFSTTVKRSLSLGAGALLCALFAQAFQADAAEPEQLEGDAYRFYQTLRQQFYVAIALPPADQGIRKEHMIYYREATKFLDSLPEAMLRVRASVLYRRARIVLHCGRHQTARKDLAKAMELLENAPPREDDDTTVGGVPTLGDLKLYHALSFENEGQEALLDKLAALPDNAVQEHADTLRTLLIEMALELDRQEDFRLEIRVFQLIKKFKLATGDADDPDKHIALLRAKLGEPVTEPEQDGEPAPDHGDGANKDDGENEGEEEQ